MWCFDCILRLCIPRKGPFPLCFMRRIVRSRTNILAQNGNPHATFVACVVNQKSLFLVGVLSAANLVGILTFVEEGGVY